MSSQVFNCKYAIVCSSIPNSIESGLSLGEHDAVNVDKAREEHRIYLQALKDAGLKLIEIEASEDYPDCVFVEDVAVVVDGKIFLTNPGAISRRGEIRNARDVIEKFTKEHPELGIEIGSIRNTSEAFIDGGDVCFTGRELLVGISSRTNHKGAQELAEFFRDIPVTTVNVNSVLHLKSAFTIANFDTFLVSTSGEAQTIRREVEAKCKFNQFYKFLEVDDNRAANVLFFNQRLYFPEHFKHNIDNIKALEHVHKQALPNLEFEKLDGCLTCRSILF